jgi:carboxypeptidase C (cathepsin A)
MSENDRLRVFVASGYFDTAASIGADEYLLTHNALDVSRIVARRYVGGHMFYSVPESRVRISSELKRFVSNH